MASEVFKARESSVVSRNVHRTSSTGRLFANEKRMQDVYGLRHRPDRYSSLERARNGLQYYTKPHMIVQVGDNDRGFTKGYYVAVPADASRLEKKGFKIYSSYGK